MISHAKWFVIEIFSSNANTTPNPQLLYETFDVNLVQTADNRPVLNETVEGSRIINAVGKIPDAQLRTLSPGVMVAAPGAPQTQCVWRNPA